MFDNFWFGGFGAIIFWIGLLGCAIVLYLTFAWVTIPATILYLWYQTDTYPPGQRSWDRARERARKRLR